MTGASTGRALPRVVCAGVVLAAGAVLASCGSAGDADPQVGGTTAAAASAPTSDSARAESLEASRGMAEPGAAFARALTAHGIPAQEVADDATLAQLARGICAQTSAGTPPDEIRARLAPVIRFSQSLVGDAMNEDQLTEAFLDSARGSVC